MSYTVSVDLTDWNRLKDELADRFDSIGQMLMQFADGRIIPQLEAEAASQRQVRTGLYSGGWEARQEDEKTAVVTTPAYYWKFLEFGTLTKRTAFRKRGSGGILLARTGGKGTIGLGGPGGITPKPVIGKVLTTVKDDLVHFLSGLILGTTPA